MTFILMMALNLTMNLVRTMTREAIMKEFLKTKKTQGRKGTVARTMVTEPATKKEGKTTKRNYRLCKQLTVIK